MELIREAKTGEALTEVDAVVDALGGTGKVAALVGASVASVSNWRAAGRMPARTFLIMREALAAIGKAAPAALWSIDEPAKPEISAGAN